MKRFTSLFVLAAIIALWLCAYAAGLHQGYQNGYRAAMAESLTDDQADHDMMAPYCSTHPCVGWSK